MSDTNDTEHSPTLNRDAPGPSWHRRIAASLLGAALAAVLVGLLEGRAMAGEYAGMLRIATAFGLVLPLALLVGAAAGVLAVWLAPLATSGAWGVKAWDAQPLSRRRVAVVFALGLLLALPLWLLGGARITLDALLVSGDAPSLLPVAGLTLACGGLLLLSALRKLAAEGSRWVPERLRPSHVALGVSVLAVALVALLARSGNTSGAGGAFEMYGVLERQELDLRAPLYLLVIAACAFQLPNLLARLPWVVSLLLALGGLSCTALASRWLDDPTLSLATERSTAFAARSLSWLRAITDADGDGFAGRFGGGDCDDRAPTVNPTADDVPGNGIDEDCSGGDAEPMAPVKTPPPVAATATATGSASAPATSGIPEDLNVVLITVDTLRWDIGFTGYPRKITPNIDALAARSVYFDKAYALASYTAKSLGPMLIGRYGSETHRGPRHFSIFEPIDKMVQERLQAVGVFTVSVQGHWYFKENTGLGRGFDILDLSAMPEERQGEGDRTVNSDKISDAALAHLQDPRLGSKRFFMWVHYLDPHAEYVKHEGFDFGDDARALYDGEVAFTDHHVGRVIDAIGKSSFAERTAIVVTSDHGEAFDEHGMNRHGFEIWDVLVRVPLLIYVPTVEPHRVEVRRSLIDLVPTLLELYGIEPPGRGRDDFLSGTSLLKDLTLPEGYTPEVRPIFIDMPGGPFVPERQGFINAEGRKIVTSKLRPMGIFDLEKDPGETNNLVRDVELAKTALEEMKQFRRQLQRVTYPGD